MCEPWDIEGTSVSRGDTERDNEETCVSCGDTDGDLCKPWGH